jgi:hypothetical protein
MPISQRGVIAIGDTTFLNRRTSLSKGEENEICGSLWKTTLAGGAPREKETAHCELEKP